MTVAVIYLGKPTVIDFGIVQRLPFEGRRIVGHPPTGDGYRSGAIDAVIFCGDAVIFCGDSSAIGVFGVGSVTIPATRPVEHGGGPIHLDRAHHRRGWDPTRTTRGVAALSRRIAVPGPHPTRPVLTAGIVCSGEFARVPLRIGARPQDREASHRIRSRAHAPTLEAGHAFGSGLRRAVDEKRTWEQLGGTSGVRCFRVDRTRLIVSTRATSRQPSWRPTTSPQGAAPPLISQTHEPPNVARVPWMPSGPTALRPRDLVLAPRQHDPAQTGVVGMQPPGPRVPVQDDPVAVADADQRRPGVVR